MESDNIHTNTAGKANETTVMTEVKVEAKVDVTKCSRRGCYATEETQQCKAPGCMRQIHYSCYTSHVRLKHKLNVVFDTQGNELVACRKLCYVKMEKFVATGMETRLPWDKDGKGGQEDPNNSEKILLDWLLTEGNYSQSLSGKG